MKKYNPYKVHTGGVNRFRGLTNEDRKFNISPEYVGNISNLTSDRIGELNQRDGQTDGDLYESAIVNAGRLLTAKYTISDGNVYSENLSKVGVLPVKDYQAPSSWEYPWSKVSGIPSTLTESLPVTTCSDVWDSNSSLSLYENSSEADTEVVYDTSACWTITCADLWALWPEYSEFEDSSYSAKETTLSGGVTPVNRCWTQQLNCKALYKLHPEWDEYKTTSQDFPDCWEFGSEFTKPTCEEVFEKLSTPEELQNKTGTYPNCLKDNYEDNAEYYATRLDSFILTPELYDQEVTEGYTALETKQSYQCIMTGYWPSTPFISGLGTPKVPDFLSSQVALNYTSGEYEVGGKPTKTARLNFSLTVKEGQEIFLADNSPLIGTCSIEAIPFNSDIPFVYRVAYKPPAPTNLTATKQTDSIDVDWDEVEGSNVLYYVYRATVAGGPYDLIDTTPDIFYADTESEGGYRNYYVVTASLESGLTSDYSNEASAISPEPMPTPTGVRVSSAYGALTIRWDEYPFEGFIMRIQVSGTSATEGYWNAGQTLVDNKVFHTSSGIYTNHTYWVRMYVGGDGVFPGSTFTAPVEHTTPPSWY